ncbi:hypothetical protein CDAR_266651 [Caerostris darwini]|uniref:Uncharacterized protein n=1 Tax=Caerostris darwini TaxID=1538125 RepID=A0AAV4QK47_9ARAC|nr:hypothetical protein CDAR_266651 [Caerostris darwini]
MGNTPATLLIGGMFLEEEGGGVWDERKSTVNCGRVRLEWMERTLGKRRASRPPVDVRSTAVGGKDFCSNQFILMSAKLSTVNEKAPFSDIVCVGFRMEVYIFLLVLALSS